MRLYPYISLSLCCSYIHTSLSCCTDVFMCCLYTNQQDHFDVASPRRWRFPKGSPVGMVFLRGWRAILHQKHGLWKWEYHGIPIKWHLNDRKNMEKWWWTNESWIFFWRCSTNPRGLPFQYWSNWVTMARDRALGQWVSWLSRLPWLLESGGFLKWGYPKSCKSWMTMALYCNPSWLIPHCKEPPNLFMDPSHRISWDATTTAANPMKIGIFF